MSSPATKYQNNYAHSSKKKICRGCGKKHVNCSEKMSTVTEFGKYLQKKRTCIWASSTSHTLKYPDTTITLPFQMMHAPSKEEVIYQGINTVLRKSNSNLCTFKVKTLTN